MLTKCECQKKFGINHDTGRPVKLKIKCVALVRFCFKFIRLVAVGCTFSDNVYRSALWPFIFVHLISQRRWLHLTNLVADCLCDVDGGVFEWLIYFCNQAPSIIHLARLYNVLVACPPSDDAPKCCSPPILSQIGDQARPQS